MRTKEQEEFVKSMLKKAHTQDESPKPHKSGNFDDEVESITKNLTASYADKKK